MRDGDSGACTLHSYIPPEAVRQGETPPDRAEDDRTEYCDIIHIMSSHLK